MTAIATEPELLGIPDPEPSTGKHSRRIRKAKPARAAGPVNPTVVYLTWALRALAGLAVWLLLYAFVFSAVQEQRSQGVQYDALRTELSQETVPIAAPITIGAPIALLNAPVLGLKNLVISEGTAPAVTKMGPGHLRNTVLPGQPGVSVIFGRSLMFGAPFKNVGHLRAGDLISVTTGQGTFNFHVLDVRRVGDPLPPALASGASRLVLETSAGSSLAPTSTEFVDAALTGQPTAPGQTTAISPQESAMSGDTGYLSTLLLWMEGLLLSALAVVWAAHKWGRWQTWLVGTPIVLAFAWGATSSAALLLPNLL
jgi:sortase A